MVNVPSIILENQGVHAVLPTTPSVVWPRYIEKGRKVRCWLGGQLLFFWETCLVVLTLRCQIGNGGETAE